MLICGHTHACVLSLTNTHTFSLTSVQIQNIFTLSLTFHSFSLTTLTPLSLLSPPPTQGLKEPSFLFQCLHTKLSARVFPADPPKAEESSKPPCDGKRGENEEREKERREGRKREKRKESERCIEGEKCVRLRCSRGS